MTSIATLPSGAAPPSGPSVGMTFVPSLPPERLLPLARTTEDAGFDMLWVWEDCFKETGITAAAAALASTQRLGVGIALLPAPLRNVALTAMEFATLERMFPGRLVAGVGHGVQEWMAQVGARAASPLTLLREYADALRALLAGQRVSTDGAYVRLADVALDWPPSVPPPVMVGGMGPRSLRLAAEVGDGLLLAGGISDAQVAEAAALVAEVRGPGFPLVASLMITTGADAENRLAAELRAWNLPLDQGIGVSGDAAAILASMRRLVELGATHIAVQPVSEEPDLDALIAVLAEEVLPELRS